MTENKIPIIPNYTTENLNYNTISSQINQSNNKFIYIQDYNNNVPTNSNNDIPYNNYINNDYNYDYNNYNDYNHQINLDNNLNNNNINNIEKENEKKKLKQTYLFFVIIILLFLFFESIYYIIIGTFMKIYIIHIEQIIMLIFVSILVKKYKEKEENKCLNWLLTILNIFLFLIGSGMRMYGFFQIYEIKNDVESNITLFLIIIRILILLFCLPFSCNHLK